VKPVWRSMNPVYLAGWIVFRACFAVYFRCRFFNPERVPLEGPVILAANHASFLDPPFIGSALRRSINYLAKESLFRVPVFGWVLRQWQVVPVDREGGGAKGLKAILDRLMDGNAIILFPEGTRTLDGRLQPGRSGIGLTVLKTQAPVVPVRVFGTFSALKKGRRLPKPCQISVKFGAPLYFEQYRTEAQTCSKQRLKQLYQEVADDLMTAIGNLGPYRDKAQFP